jgi:hypothetical protein
MGDGNYMNIENLKESFNCGQKDESELIDFSIKVKSDLEVLVEDLKARIETLEK